MTRIGIVGAGSFIGNAVAASLRQAHADEFDVCEIDVRGEAWRAEDFSHYDSLLHVAGVVPWALDRKRLGIATAAEEQAYLDSVNADLAYEIGKKARGEGVGHLAFLSTSDVYAKSDSADPRAMVDESTRPQPQSAYGKSKLKAEKMLRELESADFAVSLLRLPMVYGPNCTRGSFASLARLAAKTPVFPNVQNARSTLFTGNLAELVGVLSVTRDRGVFLPQDPAWASTSQLVSLLAKAQGNRVRLVGWASAPCGFLARHNATARKVFGNFRYDLESSKSELGYQRFELSEAIELSVANSQIKGQSPN